MAQSVIEKAKQHFIDKLQGGLKCIEVPEWDTKIYYKPLNLTQQDRIYKYIRDGSLESMAETLIVRALDENGVNLFRNVNKTELMNMVDPGVMQNIIVAMADDDEDEDFEETVKN